MSPEHIHTYLTAIGMVSLTGDGERITGVYLPNYNLPAMPEGEDEVMEEAIKQLEEYFSGRRKDFDIPVYQEGTDFQKDIWDAMCRIGYGETVTYGRLAEMAGHPGAYRAAGTACGGNRLPIIIPCHRIVASNGIGNYGGGVSLKKRLLTLESEFR
ncbi:MAG: methylated-DNA--[protein]-cysteine S-methyltransferase [archaeon]|nr:methylated-DNA--[protein]-cysteine S-methyltransferase [archaeon]